MALSKHRASNPCYGQLQHNASTNAILIPLQPWQLGKWATQCYMSRKSFGSGQYARALPRCKASVPQIRREPHRTDNNPPPRPSTREILCQSPLRNRSQWLFNLGFTSDGKVPSTVLGCTVVHIGQLIPYRALSASKAVYQKHRLMATACTLLNRDQWCLSLTAFAVRRYGRPTEQFSRA